MSERHRRAGEQALTHVEALADLLSERVDVLSVLDRSAILRAASHRIQNETSMDLGFASHLEGPDLLVIRGWAGSYGGVRNLEVPRGFGLGGRAFALAKPVQVPDYCTARSITHHFDAVIRSEQIHAMAAVPLIHGGQPIGVVYVAQREAIEIGGKVVQQLHGVAAPTAQALHLAARVESDTTTAISAERHRIAVALHDSVGAMLFTIGAELRGMQCDVVETPDLKQKLQGLERRIAETAACFRESLSALDGVASQQALTTTLRGDCDAFSARTGVVARCVTLGELPELDTSQRAALVSLAREALVNVEKHASASSVVISVASAKGGITLAIADDGIGWTEAGERALTEPTDQDRHPRVDESSSGIGLRASYERLAQLGGTLTVVGNEDGGLTVRAWLPAA